MHTLETPAPPESDRGPRWLGTALTQTFGELREFLATGLAFSRHPARFDDEWYRGERRAMNPLGCLATGAAIIVPAQEFLRRWLPPEEQSSSVVAQVLEALGPYLYYSALGAAAHLVLRLLGSRRSLLGSVGIALYAGALPGLVASLLVTAIAALLFARKVVTFDAPALSPASPFGAAMLVGVLSIFFAFLGTACVGLAGLHRVSRWRSLLALVIALVITGLVFGQTSIPGNYGLHFSLHVWEGGRFVEPGFGLII